MNKKRFIRIISVFLCLCMALSSSLAISAQQDEGYNTTPDENGCYTDCKGDCEHSPTIIIPGIGQSKSYLADENGEKVYDSQGKQITGWPLYVDVVYAVKELLFPLLRMLIFQQDFGLTDKAGRVITELFKWNRYDENGKLIHNIVVEKYPQSVARCNEAEQDYIYNCIPLQDYSDRCGADHLYFFAYNSFGNNIEICNELYDFIQQVKRETGHDKVNLAPISLGGTIANGLLDYHPEVVNDLDRVAFIIPALDGSKIVGDVFRGTLSTSDEMLYDYMFPALTDDKLTGNLINIAIRIVPKKVLLKLLDQAILGLMDGALRNCTTMWSLVPSDDYEYCRAKWLSGSEHDAIRAQTDRYYEAQKNSLRNIQRLRDNGVDVFDVVDYSFPLYCLVPSWSEYNADGVIHIESTGMGIYSVPTGQQLPADYVQRNENKIHTDNCSDHSHNHISPDRELDASTCLLPDNTFFFYGQDHEGTGRNDVIMKLATAILEDDHITDVYSDPEFPQFNVGRETKKLRNNVLPQAKSIDQSKLSAEDAAKLNAAIKACEDTLATTVVVPGEAQRVEKELKDVMISLGVMEPEEDNTANEKFGELLEKINKWLNKTLGYRGFSDPINEVLFG